MARKCKGCCKDIRHKHPNAKFCTRRCKDRYWNTVNPRGYGLMNEAQQIAEGSFDPGWDGHKDSF